MPRRLQSCLISSTEQRAEREATRDFNATAILHVSVRVRAVVCGFGYGGVWVQVCVWFMWGGLYPFLCGINPDTFKRLPEDLCGIKVIYSWLYISI